MQCGPYFCEECGASEMGPEKYGDNFEHSVTPEEWQAGWYRGDGKVSPYANTVSGPGVAFVGAGGFDESVKVGGDVKELEKILKEVGTKLIIMYDQHNESFYGFVRDCENVFFSTDGCDSVKEVIANLREIAEYPTGRGDQE